jgi:hypothetical protein
MGDGLMYAEVYDRDQNHLANIQIKKWNITRRVFDFDTSQFEGYCEEDITEGQTFVFKGPAGKYHYSGFMKNVTQDEDGYVKFKGDDLRRIFDTEVLLDYSQTDYVTQPENTFNLHEVYYKVRTQVEATLTGFYTIQAITPTIGSMPDTHFIANPSGTYLIVNAWKYLKPYLAYYGYMLEVRYDLNKLFIELKKVDETAKIRLPDFVFDKTTSETKTNHVVARIKPADNKRGITVWVYSSEEVWNATPTSLQQNRDMSNVIGPETWGPVNFEDSFADLELDYVIRVRLYEGAVGSSTLLRTFYMQPVDHYNPLPTTFVTLEYWLGNDNQVYYNTIPAAKQIIPVVTKYYEGEYLSQAQFQGVFELVNSRYVEYIILSETTQIPIDIRELVLYEMVTVYDANQTEKLLPVSEIEWTQDSYKVKLGFKKTFLTEVIKG